MSEILPKKLLTLIDKEDNECVTSSRDTIYEILKIGSIYGIREQINDFEFSSEVFLCFYDSLEGIKNFITKNLDGKFILKDYENIDNSVILNTNNTYIVKERFLKVNMTVSKVHNEVLGELYMLLVAGSFEGKKTPYYDRVFFLDKNNALSYISKYGFISVNRINLK